MFTVVLDACVLVPATLADSVLRTCEAGAFGVRWSATILDEVERTMVRLGVPPDKANQRIAAMTDGFPFAAIEGHEPLIGAMRNDQKDRHVLAAAVKSECHTIVTFNLADFPADAVNPWGVEVVHPDEFLLGQLDLAPGAVMQALHGQSAAYVHPPLSVEAILGRLARCGVPDFADEARRHLA